MSLETTRVDYAYDSCGSYTRGRLCSVTAKKGSTTEVSRTAYNRYEALGRVLESTQTTGGTSYTMAYAYDRAGNLTSQRYPSDRVVDYVYDGAGRIGGVKTGADGWYAGGTGTNAVDYEPHGGVKQLLLGNGLWEQRRYNVRLQPTRIGLGTTKTTGSLTATGPTPTAGLLLLDYSYGASSNNGNVLSQRIRVGTSLNQNQVYTYDALNRLKTAGETGSGTAWSQTYTYDRYGNRRVTAGASHGSNQALTPQSTADIAAATNRLAGLKGVGGASGVTTTYVYNVGDQLVAEFGGTAPAQPGTRYLTPDPLGSTRLVTAEDQSVLSRHDYLPFGEEIGSGLGGRSSVSGYTPSRTDGPTQKFTGKERDAESQLDYFGARYFSGAGGRFTSADAPFADQFAENPQSWNLYSYTRNNPLRYVDRTGDSTTVAGGFIGGGVALYKGEDVLTGALTGAISGALAGSVIDTGGASLLVLAASGAVGGAASSLLNQAASGEGIDLGEVATDAAVGAALGPAGKVGGAALRSAAGKVLGRGVSSVAAGKVRGRC